MRTCFYTTLNLPQKHYTPSFKSSEREVFDENGKVLNRNTTGFFRSDLDWQEFATFLENKYKNVEQPNITIYGCSDGTEAYSLATVLIERTPTFAYKTFPIIAKDIDQHIISKAKSEIIDSEKSDIFAINYHLNGKFNHYFQTCGTRNPDFDFGLKPKKPLYDKIIFKQANILEDIQNLPNKNNIILCRNMWKYLGKENHNYLAQQLYEKTKHNGLVVIGSYDTKSEFADNDLAFDTHDVDIDKVLKQNGFRETNIKKVYEPIKINTIPYHAIYQ